MWGNGFSLSHLESGGEVGKTLVTGGASFIGPHLVDALVERGARVRVVDDLGSGKLENIGGYVQADRIEFIKADLQSLVYPMKPWTESASVFTSRPTTAVGDTFDLHQAGPSFEPRARRSDFPRVCGGRS